MENNELMHYGVKGMKWGVIRKRGITGNIRDIQRKNSNNTLNDVRTKKNQVNDKSSELNRYDKKQMSTQKKMAIGAAAVAATLASGYGLYKVSKLLKSEAGKRAINAGKEHFRRNINDGKFISDMNKEGKLTILNSKDWGKKVARDLDRDIGLVDQVSGSTKEAIKYLYNNRKK